MLSGVAQSYAQPVAIPKLDDDDAMSSTESGLARISHNSNQQRDRERVVVLSMRERVRERARARGSPGFWLT